MIAASAVSFGALAVFGKLAFDAGVGVSTVTPILLFFSGLRRVGASMAAILSTLEPPTTVLLAFAAFGESPTAVQLTGGALVLGAVVLVQQRPTAPATA